MIRTARLHLTPLGLADAPAIQTILADPEVNRGTLGFPYPFVDGLAVEMVERIPPRWTVLGIRRRPHEPILGSVGLHVDGEHPHRAELAYWLARSCWGRGYATEAARAVCDHGFEVLGLERLFATSLGFNTASRRVLEKLGMRYEGCLRRHVRHWGRYEDLHCYALLADEHRAEVSQRRPTP